MTTISRPELVWKTEGISSPSLDDLERDLSYRESCAVEGMVWVYGEGVDGFITVHH